MTTTNSSIRSPVGEALNSVYRLTSQWARVKSILERVVPWASGYERGAAIYDFGFSRQATTLQQQLFKYEKDPNMTDEKRRELIRQAIRPRSPSPSSPTFAHESDAEEEAPDDQLNTSSSSNSSIKSHTQSKSPASTLRRRRRTETTV